MSAYFKYMFQYYVRFYQYVAPLLVFFIAIFTVYSSDSSNALGTYAFGSIWVFLESTWLAYGYTRVEHTTANYDSPYGWNEKISVGTSIHALDRTLSLVWTFAYALILMVLYVKLAQRRLFD